MEPLGVVSVGSEWETAEQLCRHMAGLSGADCALMRLDIDNAAAIRCVGGDWFCRRCAGCDYANTLHYGCSEAYRWNGNYVFYCPKGLVFAAASLTDEQSNLSGGLVLGPVVMGEPDDTFALFEDGALRRSATRLPQWDTVRVRDAEHILRRLAATVCAGARSRFDGYVYEQEKLLSRLYEIQNELTDGEDASTFLIKKEKQLNSLIALQDKDGAQQLLNDIFAYIYLAGQNDLSTIKARLIEMLVLLSRSAIDAGAGAQEILLLNEESLRQIARISSLEDLGAWVTAIAHRFIQYSFDFSRVKHADVLYKIMQYVKANCDRKITLEDVAGHVYLSRSYVSSIFKDEMGESLFAYVNRIRVEKSKHLLRNDSVSLADVSGMCGFEDQSYFTKVFKSIVGMSPKKYRDSQSTSDTA